MNKLENYCRKNREKSISPSISLEISQIGQLSEDEKKEKFFYNALVQEMLNEVSVSFDDLIKNINFFLRRNIIGLLKDHSDNEMREIISQFFEKTFKCFKNNFDELEVNSNFILNLKDFNHDLSKFIIDKNKRKNLIPIFNNDDNSSNIFSPLKNFDYEKNKMDQLFKDNLYLRMELALETKIQKSIEQNFDNLKEKFTFLEGQIKKKPDMAYIDKNIDIMSNKLKMMKREISQLNI